MDVGTILFGLALIVIVAFLVARPLIERRGPRDGGPDPASHLTAEKESVLAAIRDLDFDHATGKINAEDHAAQRAQLTARAVSIMKELDSLGLAPAGAAPELESPSDLDAQIEARVAARRGRASSTVSAESPAGRCPACGSPSQAGDRFCHKCGANLAADR